MIQTIISQKTADGRNEPAFLRHILRTVARCVGKLEEEVAIATTKAATAFFRI